MRPRHADTLRQMGYDGELSLFRRTLLEVKRELFPDLSVDELCYTRDEASAYCQEVKKRLNAPRVTRVFLLRALVGIRKNVKLRKELAQ